MTNEMIAGICPLKIHQPSACALMISVIFKLPVKTTMVRMEKPEDN